MTRVLLAFSDTGSGHRAAACALRDALGALDATVVVSLVDPYALSARWPFNRLSAAYPLVVNNASWLWRHGFRLTNSRALTATLQSLAWPALRRTFRALQETESPDVIVTTHPLLTAPLRRTFPHTPLMVVVTDLMTGHAAWYDRRAEAIVLPTEEARARAIAGGVAPQATEVLGVPVATSSRVPREATERVLDRLQWSVTRPTILIVGGGDGVGPLESLALAVDRAQLGCDVAVVTGRNAPLAERLRARTWHGIVHVYGFVHNLDDMLCAASALLTKAGPGTISEACVSGCPMVLYGAIPGQETGNIRFVEEGGAGMLASGTSEVVDALRAWLVGDGAHERREAAAAAALRLGRPRTALDIAVRILGLAGRTAGQSSHA